MTCKTHKLKMKDGICDGCLREEDAAAYTKRLVSSINRHPAMRKLAALTELIEAAEEMLSWTEKEDAIPPRLDKRLRAAVNKARR